MEWTSFDLTQEPQNGGIGKKNNRGGAEEVAGERVALFGGKKSASKRFNNTSILEVKSKENSNSESGSQEMDEDTTDLDPKRSQEERKNCFSSSCA